MKPLDKHTSEALDALLQGLPANVVEAARELFVANNDHEMKLSAKAFQIVVHHELKKATAIGIRKAIEFASQKIDRGADPVEGLCFVEDYANSIDPDKANTVVSISGGLTR